MMKPATSTIFSRLTSAVVLCAFLVTFVARDGVLALASLPSQESVMPSFAPPPVLSIPSSLGYTTAQAVPAQSGHVVWIQDLHGHEEMQRTIAALIQYLDKTYGVGKVLLEGAPRGPLTTAWLGALGKGAAGRRTTDRLLAEGLLTGPELYGITSGTDKLEGMEDWAVYRENRARLIRLMDHERAVGNIIAAARTDIADLQNDYYGWQTKRASRKLEERGADALRRYRSLLKMARSQGIATSAYVHLTAYLSSAKELQRVPIDAVRTETAWCVNELRTRLPFRAYTALMEQGRDGMGREFLLALADAARRQGMASSVPALTRYAAALQEQGTVDPLALFAEETALTRQVFNTSTQDTLEREIVDLARLFGIFEAFASLKVTKRDYDAFQDEAMRFKTLVIKYLEPDTASFVIRLTDSRDLREYYTRNIDRNRIFVQSIVDASGTASRTPGLTVVVAGGFHGDIMAMLEARGLSCSVVTPRIRTPYDDARYRAILTGQEKDDIAAAAFAPERLARMSPRSFKESLLAMLSANPALLADIPGTNKAIAAYLDGLDYAALQARGAVVQGKPSVALQTRNNTPYLDIVFNGRNMSVPVTGDTSPALAQKRLLTAALEQIGLGVVQWAFLSTPLVGLAAAVLGLTAIHIVQDWADPATRPSTAGEVIKDLVSYLVPSLLFAGTFYAGTMVSPLFGIAASVFTHVVWDLLYVRLEARYGNAVNFPAALRWLKLMNYDAVAQAQARRTLDLIQDKLSKTTVIIQAGGKAQRLGGVNKPMQRLAGIPLYTRLLNALKAVGVKSVITTTSAAREDWGREVQQAGAGYPFPVKCIRGEPGWMSSLCDALREARAQGKEYAIVLMADVIPDVDLLGHALYSMEPYTLLLSGDPELAGVGTIDPVSRHLTSYNDGVHNFMGWCIPVSALDEIEAGGMQTSISELITANPRRWQVLTTNNPYFNTNTPEEWAQAEAYTRVHPLENGFETGWTYPDEYPKAMFQAYGYNGPIDLIKRTPKSTVYKSRDGKLVLKLYPPHVAGTQKFYNDLAFHTWGDPNGGTVLWHDAKAHAIIFPNAENEQSETLKSRLERECMTGCVHLDRVMMSLAGTLRAVHREKFENFGPVVADLRNKSAGQQRDRNETYFAYETSFVRQRIDDLRQSGLDPPSAGFLDKWKGRVNAMDVFTLNHGDFAPWNVMVDKASGDITAIFDGEDASVAAPARDVAITVLSLLEMAMQSPNPHIMNQLNNAASAFLVQYADLLSEKQRKELFAVLPFFLSARAIENAWVEEMVYKDFAKAQWHLYWARYFNSLGSIDPSATFPLVPTEITLSPEQTRGAHTVQVSGFFNNWTRWTVPFDEARGVFALPISLPKGYAMPYRIIVDGVWQDDRNACYVADDGRGGRNSIIDLVEDAQFMGPLHQRLNDILADGNEPLLSIDIDDTIVPLFTSITEHEIETMVRFLESGGRLVFNTRTPRDNFYLRVLEPLVAGLHSRRKMYLLDRVGCILDGGKQIFSFSDGKAALVYEDNRAPGKGVGLLRYLDHLRVDGLKVKVLTHIGDRYNTGNIDDGGVLESQVDSATGIRLAQEVPFVANVGAAFFSSVPRPRQVLLNAHEQGPFVTLRTMTLLTTDLSSKLFRKRPALAAEGEHDVWTPENQGTFTRNPGRTVMVRLPRSGFVWAGTRAVSGQWHGLHMVPLVKGEDGAFYAALPENADVFTVFWAGGSNIAAGTHGTWEGITHTVPTNTSSDVPGVTPVQRRVIPPLFRLAAIMSGYRAWAWLADIVARKKALTWASANAPRLANRGFIRLLSGDTLGAELEAMAQATALGFPSVGVVMMDDMSERDRESMANDVVFAGTMDVPFVLTPGRKGTSILFDVYARQIALDGAQTTTIFYLRLSPQQPESAVTALLADPGSRGDIVRELHMPAGIKAALELRGCIMNPRRNAASRKVGLSSYYPAFISRAGRTYRIDDYDERSPDAFLEGAIAVPFPQGGAADVQAFLRTIDEAEAARLVPAAARGEQPLLPVTDDRPQFSAPAPVPQINREAIEAMLNAA